MDTTSVVVFAVVLLLAGLGTFTLVAKDASGAESARYVVAVVVLAGLFGLLLTAVGSAL
jgi:hypothetical protein